MIRPVVAQSYPLDRAALLLLQASERFSMGRGIIVGGAELSALNLFGLISQLGPDQCHRNQQRLHPLITRRFRACEAVRSLLSTLAYNGKAVHEPREDVTGQVGRQAAGHAPGAFCLPMTLRSPLVLVCPFGPLG
jgi:hypothetical protein